MSVGIISGLIFFLAGPVELPRDIHLRAKCYLLKLVVEVNSIEFLCTAWVIRSVCNNGIISMEYWSYFFLI